MALHFNTVQRHFRILLVWFRYDQYFVLFHFDCPCRTGVYADPAPDTFARVRDMRIHIRSSFFHYYAECRANFYTGLTPRTILIVKFHDWIIHFFPPISPYSDLLSTFWYMLKSSPAISSFRMSFLHERDIEHLSLFPRTCLKYVCFFILHYPIDTLDPPFLVLHIL